MVRGSNFVDAWWVKLYICLIAIEVGKFEDTGEPLYE